MTTDATQVTQALVFEPHNGFGGLDPDGNPWPVGYISEGVGRPIFEILPMRAASIEDRDIMERIVTAWNTRTAAEATSIDAITTIKFAAHQWWRRYGMNGTAEELIIGRDGRVTVRWRDADESGRYTLPADFMEADLAASLSGCEEYLKPGQTPAERMKQDHEEILGLMKLLEKTKWALQDAVSTNAENCRQRDWWRHAHGTVEAELTANERKVNELIAAEAASKAREAKMREALENIRQWAENAYGTDIFEEPDLDAVNRVLTENGLRGHMDRMHASWGRHLMHGVGQIARAALASTSEGEG